MNQDFSIIRGRSAFLFWIVVLLVILITSLPYWIAWNSGTPGHEFAGLLMNPIDGNSYLAKMRQGWDGVWRFQLPFTAVQGRGAFLFLFYLGLGHLARLSGMSLILMYHLARIAAAVLMLAGIARNFHYWLPGRKEANFAFILAAFGAGLGWLLLPFSAFTADFWVGESYPFLSAYTNPHFPLTIGLLLLLFTPGKKIRFYEFGTILLSILLGIISPFAVLVGLGVLGILGGIGFYRDRQPSWAFLRFVWLLIGGGLVLAYDVVAVSRDPILAGWNLQNITATPPIWDFILSFSPAVLLAFLGGFLVAKKRVEGGQPFLVWLLLVIAVIYLPLNLQRRMLVGFYVPAAGLASIGLARLARGSPRRFSVIGTLIFLVSIPTSILVILAGIHGARTLDPALYLDRSEAEAFRWIEQATDPDALILSGPETGLFIPARTGRRVIYGHPFETVDANEERANVEEFFSGEMAPARALAFLSDREIDRIFFGPRERLLGDPEILERLEVVYQNDEVTIFASVGGDPDH